MTQIHFLSFVSLDYDTSYIPHLLKHYASFDAITDFHLILHSETGRLSTTIAVESVDQRPLILHRATGTFLGPQKLARLNELISSFPEQDWIIVADADELIEFPDQDLHRLVDRGSDTGAYYGRFLDHTTETGEPRDVAPGPSLFEQFPKTEERTKDIGASILKPVLFRRHQLVNAHSLEDAPPGPWIPVATIHHFKWTLATREKLLRRVSDYREADLSWWPESVRALKKYYGIEIDRNGDS